MDQSAVGSGSRVRLQVAERLGIGIERPELT